MSGLGRRGDALAGLSERSFDVLVVGGGIVGAGVLLEATLRGYRAALVERNDFASGTSSRSSKLVHGGLRYLARGEVGIVRDALRERANLLRRAPSLVRPMPHVFPLRSQVHRLAVRATLTLYDRLGSQPAHTLVSRDEIAARDPDLARLAPFGAARYHEAQADDTRLVFATLVAAVERGAIVANHIAALRRRRWGDRVRTALRDERGGATIEVEARCVVVAVGAHFGDARADFDWRAMALRPAKGIHAVLRVTPRDANVLIRSPRDGRYLNTLPWHGHVLAGTTDTPASREEIDDPRPSAEDVAYVLDAVRPLYPDSDKRVRAAWAGIRPLINAGGATTVGLSREDEIASPEPGVLAVAGGKMTTYQAMARRTMDLVDRNIGRRRASEEAPLDDPLPPSGKRLVSDAPFTRGELEAAARDGMVETLDDLLTQRVGITLVAPDAVREHARDWAKVVAPILGWDESRVARETEDVRTRAARFAPP